MRYFDLYLLTYLGAGFDRHNVTARFPGLGLPLIDR